MDDAPDHLWAVFDIDISAQTTDIYAQNNPDGFVDPPTKYTRTAIIPVLLSAAQARVAKLEAALEEIQNTTSFFQQSGISRIAIDNALHNMHQKSAAALTPCSD
jgi:phosphoketolase